MKKISLYGKDFFIESDEFELEYYQKYNNLIIYKDLGKLEKLSGFLSDISEIYNNDCILIWCGGSHGNFVPIDCSSNFKKVYISNLSEQLNEQTRLNINSNANNSNANNSNAINSNANNSNIEIISMYQIQNILKEKDEKTHTVFYTDTDLFLTSKKFDTVIVNREKNKIDIDKYGYTKYFFDEYYIYPTDREPFYNNFRYYFNGDVFAYDNLINLCIMVKNGGELFKKMLKENYSLIDRYTILDTGSTDGTIEFIKSFLKDKKGKLYEEPFIDFGKSRNRCLELAKLTCKYNLMLDDTYIVQGNLRTFLNKVRGDQFGNSFSLYIRSADNEYVSNRITKTKDNLKYIFKIHEVIQFENNKNVIVPIDDAMIFDERAEYMEERTMTRKQLDLKLLFEEVEEDPNNPRHLYYIAQTYSLLQNYEKAAEFFEKRINHPIDGFMAEKHDACFELARLYNFKLNKPWELCETIYMRAYELDKKRPESFYFIGIHYYMEGNRGKAYDYFVKAYDLGYPLESQYSLKPTLSYHYLPKFLTELCYDNKNYLLGLEASTLFLEKNKPGDDFYDVMINYNSIFKCLVEFQNVKNLEREKFIINRDKKKIVFLADGGFNPWNGSSILNDGVGGSETFIIEMAKYLAKYSDLDIYVFCRCKQEEIFENVSYFNFEKFLPFIQDNNIHTVIVSRYIEYLPTVYLGNVDNVYLIMHDLCLPGSIVISNNRLRNIFCLTPWHCEYFTSVFPMYKDIIKPFGYGVDKIFHSEKIKQGKKFIYSSFPNRGLKRLLEMWNKITNRFPDASLDLYVDLDNNWVKSRFSADMDYIKSLLPTLKNVSLKGWVNKTDLAKGWGDADIWFYPCCYHETFCLTALEAAASNTFIVTNDLAGLRDTVGERGLIIRGDANTIEWETEALHKLFNYMERPQDRNSFIEKNKKWVEELTWENKAKEFYDKYINKLSLIGLHNWTSDLPFGSKAVFDKVLQDNREKVKKVLEVGTYTGISLIHILDVFKDAVGYAVDKWADYEEFDSEGKVLSMSNIQNNNIQEVFIKNIKARGYENRVRFFKDDSVSALLKFVANRERFDFIYVDGSHLMLDCYVDLVLSWSLLNSGGILAVDDVLFANNFENVVDNIMNKPLLGVDHFLLKYRGSYEIIHKGYRLFLKKL